MCRPLPAAFHHQARVVDRRNASGSVPNFSKFANYSWTIAASSSGVQNFATNKFVLDTSSFSNDFSGGSFSLTSDGNSLQFATRRQCWFHRH